MKTYTLTESELQELLRQQREICAEQKIHYCSNSIRTDRIINAPSPLLPTEEVGIKEDDLQSGDKDEILCFLEPLIYYSQIHTVKGVIPAGMISHEEARKKAQQWLWENYKIENDKYVPSDNNNEGASVASHSCTMNNSIEREIQSVCNEVGSELLRAKTLFPEKFVNQHEAYAVILEEIDELWDEIKKNQRNYDLPAQRKEAIQAAAMLVRLVVELLNDK